MEEACKSLKLVRFFLFFPAEFFFSQIFLRGRILSHRFHRYTQIFMESLVNLFVQSQGVSATTGQVASAKSA